MKRYAAILILSLAFAQAQAQTRKTTVRHTQQRNQPNVSGEPTVLTPPVLDKAAPQPEPEMRMNIKKQRKVRVVPAPPPPGPIAPAMPPR